MTIVERIACLRTTITKLSGELTLSTDKYATAESLASDIMLQASALRAARLELAKFEDYVESFYGSGGIYDMKVTRAQIADAVRTYIDKPGVDFCGDSIDREHVRDILIAQGAQWPG